MSSVLSQNGPKVSSVKCQVSKVSKCRQEEGGEANLSARAPMKDYQKHD